MKTTDRSYFVTEQHVEYINDESKRLGCFKSAIVRAALDEYIDRKEKDNEAMLHGKKPLKTIVVDPNKKQAIYQKTIGQKNRMRVKRWLVNNPDKPKTMCSKALKLSQGTVDRHIWRLKRGII